MKAQVRKVGSDNVKFLLLFLKWCYFNFLFAAELVLRCSLMLTPFPPHVFFQHGSPPESTWSIPAEGSGRGACCCPASWRLFSLEVHAWKCAPTPLAGEHSAFTKGTIFCGTDYLNSSTRWKKTHLTVERPSTVAVKCKFPFLGPYVELV